jgi:uncharacterized protein (DUF305 family)
MQVVETTDVDFSGRLRDRPWIPIGIGALIAVVVLAGAWFLYQAWPKPPGDESADVNFLRDMVVHHDQAVTMALIIRDRTEDQSLHDISTDIVLTQTSQIGMMRGWIDRWDYTLVSKNPHMEWMGHPVDGLMPGMATPEEIEQLRTLPVTEAEVLFSQLMIRHHAAGIEMAQAALERVDDTETRRLAESIVAGQFAEIQALQEDLEERGAAQEAVPADMSDMPGMDMVDMPAGSTATPTGG